MNKVREQVLGCVHAKLLQSCHTLCDCMDCNPQAPLSMGFSRLEYCSGLSCPSPGDLPDPGIKPESLMSPAWADSSPLNHQGGPQIFHFYKDSCHMGLGLTLMISF